MCNWWHPEEFAKPISPSIVLRGVSLICLVPAVLGRLTLSMKYGGWVVLVGANILGTWVE